MSIKSIIAQVKETISQLDKLLGSADLKDGKRADILMERSRLLTTLLGHENLDRQNTDKSKIAELTRQHEADARRIAELQDENATLRAKPDVIREVPDPEHAVIRQKNELLTAIFNFVVSLMSEEERQDAAIRALQQLPSDAVRLLCQHVGFNYVEQVQMFGAYTTTAQLREVIAKAQREGPAVRFARTMLAIRGIAPEPFAEDWR